MISYALHVACIFNGGMTLRSRLVTSISYTSVSFRGTWGAGSERRGKPWFDRFPFILAVNLTAVFWNCERKPDQAWWEHANSTQIGNVIHYSSELCGVSVEPRNQSDLSELTLKGLLHKRIWLWNASQRQHHVISSQHQSFMRCQENSFNKICSSLYSISLRAANSSYASNT